MAGSSRPDPRCRHRGPEGAAGEGHLDLQPAGPPRGGLCPSARTSPRALAPGRRRLQMSGLPLQHPGPFAARPRGLLCPPLTSQACAGRSRSRPRSRLFFSHLRRRNSPESRRTARDAGGTRAPLRRAYLRGGGGGRSGGYGGGCSARNRENRGAEGGAARTAAARTRPDSARPARRAPPRARPGRRRAGAGVRVPGPRPPAPGPLPSSALTLLRPSVPAADARAQGRVRAPASACVRPGPGRRG